MRLNLYFCVKFTLNSENWWPKCGQEWSKIKNIWCVTYHTIWNRINIRKPVSIYIFCMKDHLCRQHIKPWSKLILIILWIMIYIHLGNLLWNKIKFQSKARIANTVWRFVRKAAASFCVKSIVRFNAKLSAIARQRIPQLKKMSNFLDNSDKKKPFRWN